MNVGLADEHRAACSAVLDSIGQGDPRPHLLIAFLAAATNVCDKGVDFGVKTIYIPPIATSKPANSFEAFPMTAQRIAKAHRPLPGRFAFARAATAGSPGACSAALHAACPASGYPRERDEGRMHPGEASA